MIEMSMTQQQFIVRQVDPIGLTNIKKNIKPWHTKASFNTPRGCSNEFFGLVRKFNQCFVYVSILIIGPMVLFELFLRQLENRCYQ